MDGKSVLINCKYVAQLKINWRTEWIVDAKFFDCITHPPHGETTQYATSKGSTLMHCVTTGTQGDHTGKATIDTSQKRPVWSLL